MADSPVVARATVEIIPSMRGAQETISKELGAISGSSASEAGQKIGSSLSSGMGTALKAGVATVGAAAAAVGTAVVAGTKAFVDSAQEVSAYGDEIDKMSQKLGLSKQAYQEWDYVLQLSGTEMSSMTTGLKTLTNKLDDAKNGSKDAQEMFSQLGISMDELQSMSREDLFSATIAGFQQMADSTDRAALANDLFGKSGQNLAPLFNTTTDATKQMIEEAHDYGMIMSDEAVTASADFQDSMLKMQNTISGLKNSMIGELLPAATQVSDGLADLFKGDMSGADKVAAGVKSIVQGLTSAVPAILQIVTSIIQAIVDALPDLWSTINDAIVELAPQLVQTIVDLAPTLIDGIIQLITSIVSDFYTIIEPIINALPDIIIAVVDGLITALPELINGLIQLVLGIVEAMPEIIQSLIDDAPQIIQSLVEGILGALPELIAGFVELFVQLVANFGTVVMALVEAAPQIVDALITGVSDAWPAMIEEFSNLFSELGPKIEEIGKTLMSKMSEIATKMKEAFIEKISKLGASIKTKLTEGLDAVKEWGTKIKEKGTEAAKKLVTAVIDKIKEIPKKIKEVGTNIVTGLWNGISDKVAWLKEKISGFCSSAIDAIKSFFKIKSPSRVMRDEVGKYLVLGIAEGIRQNADAIDKSLDEIEISSQRSFNIGMDVDDYSTGLFSGNREGVNITNNITVNGAEDPEAWTRTFVATLRREARMA